MVLENNIHNELPEYTTMHGRIIQFFTATRASFGRLARRLTGRVTAAPTAKRGLYDRSQPPQRPIKVWDERLSHYRVVDLTNPDDPLWLHAYHVHALGKGAQTGPAF